MDPITVVGLVASIFQLLSVSHKVLASTKELHASASGSLQEVSELKRLVADIQQSSRDATKIAVSAGGQNNDSLAVLAKDCESVADALLKQLGKLELKQSGIARKVEAMKISIEFVWKKNDIQQLKSRLLELENRLDKWCIKQARERQDSFMNETIQKFASKLEDLRTESPMLELQQLRSALKECLSEVRGLRRVIEQEVPRKHMTMEESVREREAATNAHIGGLNDTAGKLCNLADKMRECQKLHRVLESLSFQSIQQRHGEIMEAHKKTLSWVFNKSKTNFPEWLEHGRGVYWVNGHAGSGKSTMMRYISEHPECMAALSAWANGAKLVVASHYFWSAGTPMQSSQQGLLQTLLYLILRSAPELVDIVCPNNVWMNYWTIDSLKDAFKTLSQQRIVNVKFCFFIDGLDEYGGAEEAIIGVIKDLAAWSQIKICTSSRPWPAFSSEWNLSSQTLAVQDFTKLDIEKYVQDKLVENAMFRKLASKDDRCDELVRNISNRASGVWLWVFLVVRDLLRDLRDREDFEHLMKRLNSFPPDLFKYFKDIMRRIDPIHQEISAQIFLVTAAAVRPLSVLLFTILDAGQNSRLAIEMEIMAASEEDIKETYLEWQIKLQNRCRDLLKINVVRDRCEPSIFKYQVDFLHRTVRDFLRDNYQEELRRTVPVGFDPIICLSKLMLINLKRIRVTSFRSNLNPLFTLVDEMLLYTRLAEMSHFGEMSAFEQDQQVELLDELDRTMTIHAGNEINHWTNARDPPDGDAREEPWLEAGQTNFIALAIQSHLRAYITYKLEEDPSLVKKKVGRPLLDYALRPKRVTPVVLPYNLQYELPWIDKDLVALLLERGADVNQKIRIYEEQSPWMLFLKSCRKNWGGWSSTTKNCACQTIELLLKHGADCDIIIPPAQNNEPNAATARYKERVVLQQSVLRGLSIQEFVDQELGSHASSLNVTRILAEISDQKNRKWFFGKLASWR